MSEFSKLPPEVKPGDGGYWEDAEGEVKPIADWQGESASTETKDTENNLDDEPGVPMPDHVRRQLADAGFKLEKRDYKPTPIKNAGALEKHLRRSRI